MIQVRRALISVSDKTGLNEFARFLASRDVEIISTGGTLKALREGGIPAKSVEDVTGFPEIMDGRVKTLHPKIHGGLLALRDNEGHVKAMKDQSITGIDLLIVNLYPFAATTARNAPFEEAIENIDIGGPAMLRAASKNYRFCAAVTDPGDYARIREEIENHGGIPEKMSLNLARTVFHHTSEYDSLISRYLDDVEKVKFPESLTVTFRKVQTMRYGENPHQEAAYYRPVSELEREKRDGSPWHQIQGKELSYNNLLDANAALLSALSLPGQGVVIVKHLNPCGAALAHFDPALGIYQGKASGNGIDLPGGLAEAFRLARACDPVSAFGGVIALTAPVDAQTAELINENFAEVIIAPGYSPEALEKFASKKNLRLLEVARPAAFLAPGMELRLNELGLLFEDMDHQYVPAADWKVVTKRAPEPAELRALQLAWRLVKHVKSNAIVFTNERASLGIGAGQMSRLDSTEIAASKAKRAGLSLVGSSVASDAFFPFRDGLDALARAGAKAVAQPGGSVRDEEVIQACDEQGIAMVFTGMRHFRH
ncbi:MAG: bifunctional phosphoribosylaminoimidazolecarboxamide formyltransferase/IMP cyclohydrolase [Spirochaetia bacterium]|nr:bifunctional phosphoribosylaminoimidazolecarboxamide formyltransferase/IMP cyclohydrolase [Spirochaetia bacterium]